ncbi:MAG: hypothetical protein CO141_03655 [Candidatus Moranbacteria bacterium CG_4_9_14_3_um_filter_42_9]|nr:MAG: hypothetical protein CO141_03655 [Candidatus Moranbacteria bacterium CG_4_9_14_3_um_filter_42_9]
MNQKINTGVGAIILVIISITAGVFVWKFNRQNSAVEAPIPIQKPKGDKIACTMKAKLCPDGTYVSRSGTNCEFAACPGKSAVDTSDWQTYRNEKYGFEFKYPSNFVYDENMIMDTDVLYSASFGLPYKEVFGKDHPNSKTAPQSINFFIDKKNDDLAIFIQDEKNAAAGVERFAENFGASKISNLFAQIVKYCNMRGYCDKTIYFTDNIYIYTIEYPISEDVVGSKVFEKIISTFKFTK